MLKVGWKSEVDTECTKDVRKKHLGCTCDVERRERRSNVRGCTCDVHATTHIHAHTHTYIQLHLPSSVYILT